LLWEIEVICLQTATIEIVYAERTCSSCYIKLPYIRAVAEEITARHPSVLWKETPLASLEEIEAFRHRSGTQAFPAVMVAGQTVSAGVIPRLEDVEACLAELSAQNGSDLRTQPWNDGSCTECQGPAGRSC